MSLLRNCVSNLFSKQTLSIITIVAGSFKSSSQSMGVSSTSITPHASSILELRATNKGMLVPRMTQAQRDAINSGVFATGLIVYNTDTNEFNYYDGTAWRILLSGSGVVNSITGTTDRISITGTSTNPVINISSNYSGQTTITTLGTVGTGTWNATAIADNKIASALTGKTYNGLSFTGLANGFTISGGTTAKTLTVAADASVSGTNTGDQVNISGNAATVTTNANLTGPVTSVGNATSITANSINNTMLSQVATQTFRGRTTAGTGNIEDLTVSQAKTLLNLTGSNSGDQTITLTGDVTGTGNGSFAATVASNAITNAKAAQMAANTIKGNNTAGLANATDLTPTQVTAMLNNFSSTLKGLVPLSGGGATNFLRADGTWAAPPGSGGLGTVTAVSVASANGFTGTVTNSTTTPDITMSTSVSGILLGDGTGIIAADPGSDYSLGTASLATGILKSTTATGDLSIAVASDFPVLNQNTTGNAATATIATTATNANITDDNTTNASQRLSWVAGTGSQALKSSSTKLTFNPSTGLLSSTAFSGSGAAITGIPNTATTASSANTASAIVARDASGNFSAGTITATTFTGALSGNAATVTTNANLTGPVTSVGNATTITANAVTNAMLAQVATQTFKGRTTAGTGNTEDLTIAQAKTLLNLNGTNSGDQTITLTGDITGSGTGSFASAIAAGAVTYSKIQNVSATNKVLGRSTAGAGSVEEIATTGSGNVVRANSPALVTPTGIVKGDVGLGNVDNTADVNKPISTATQTALDLKINASEKAANNGVATLDAGGKVPSSQLPVGSQVYKGTWNASTNTPTLADGAGTAGWTYRVATAGTVNLGSGNIAFSVGDDVIYSGTVWQRNPSSSDVTSVNTKTGTVVLTTADISEQTNLYYTDTRARASHSATAPLVYNSTSGNISIPLATTTTNGYLSSADWNTFNSKQSSGNFISAITGDITATGPGSVVSTIAPNAVTYSKMQAMSANRLLGSGATGTAVTEITLGTGLSLTGTTLNAATTGGTVTGVSVVAANGFSGTVANASSNPAITLTTPITGILKGNGTAISAAAPGTDYSPGTSALATGILKSTTSTGALSIAVAADFPTLNQNTTGNAATVTTNANLTGPVTSVGNATTITANAVTNAMLAQQATQTFKGRTSAGTGTVEDLTAVQATAMLTTFTSSTQGVVPASGGGTTTFLRADGTFATPVTAGSNYRNLVTLSADVVNSSATANTLADVTGLSFNVTAGITYRFEAVIAYNSAATTTGSRWTINGPASPTLLSYTSSYPTSSTGQTNNYAAAYSIPAASNASSLTTGNLALLTGIIKPSASGTVVIRFASEVSNSAITAKAGSTLEWW